MQHIHPKPQGRKDGVSNLIGSTFFITPYSSSKAWHALLDSFISIREAQMSMAVLFSLEDLSVQQAVLMASAPVTIEVFLTERNQKGHGPQWAENSVKL